jgi:outer membrane protein assembly factor BamB
MFKKFAAILLLIVPTLAASTTTSSARPAAQWPEFHYGPARVAFNPNETTINPGNVGTVVHGWTTRLPSAADYLLASPVMSGSRIYFVGTKLIAVDTRNGHLLWQVRPKGFAQTEATPAIDGDNIFVAWSVSSTTGVVRERDAATGSLRWSRTVPNANFSSGASDLAVRDGLVYFTVDTATTQWTLYALVENTGAIAWSDPFSGSYPFTPPALNGSVLVVGLSTGSVDAVNPMTGAFLWSAKTPAAVDGVAIGAAVAYVAEACHVIALSTATGARIFMASPPACSALSYFGPALAYGEVYVESNDAGHPHLYAINAATGAITWTTDSAGGSDPSVANHIVYLVSFTLQAYDASTGAHLLNLTDAGDSITDVSIAGGRIYIAEDGPRISELAAVYKLP